MADTRKDKRAPVSLKVRFKSATVDEFIEQYAKDISRGGVFIKSKQPMPVGTLLKFEIQLRDESPLINGVGRVVWKREPGDGAPDEAPPGMGIKFIRMDPECRATVERIAQQRGDSPGQFESGGTDEPVSAPPPKEAPFFPVASLADADLPPPEDRTQVRHASEFLASALAEGGADEVAAEAEKKAEESRKRSEQAARERALASEPPRRSNPPKESERAREPSMRTDPGASPTSSRGETSAAPTRSAAAVASPGRPSAQASASASSAAGKASPSASSSPHRAVSSPAAVRSLPPATKSPSYALPVALVLLIVAGAGGWWWFAGREQVEPGDAETSGVLPTDPAAERAADNDEEQEAPEAVLPVEPAPIEPPTAAAVPESPTAKPAPASAVATATVRIESVPPGATISFDGRALGTAPGEVSLPVGQEVELVASLRGHRDATTRVRVSETNRPLRINLTALRHIIEVTGAPVGTRLRAQSARTAGSNATSVAGPTRMVIGVPQGDVTLLASHPGHLDATRTIRPEEFTEREGVMVATIELTLEERPRAAAPARPRPVARPTSTAASEEGESAAPPEPEAPRAEVPPPAPEPAAAPPEAPSEAQ